MVILIGGKRRERVNERMKEENILEKNMKKWGKRVEIVVVRGLIRGGYLLVKVYDGGRVGKKRWEYLKIGGMIMRR